MVSGFRKAFHAALAILLVGISATRAVGQDEPGQFLVISDIHFDPFYDGTLFDRLAAEPIGRWAGILEGSRPAGFNPGGTDSNYALLTSGLDDARRRCPDPDFILYPGDFLAHQWQDKYDELATESHLENPAAYRAFTAKVIRFLAAEFRRRYPRTPILPTLGNDDSFCGDYKITPDSPFLEMFADAWETLLGPDLDRASFRATFHRGGYYSITLPRLAHHRLIVLNSVFFSVDYDNACGSSTQTPALDQLRWLSHTLGQAREDGEAVWLLMHVPPGIDSFDTVTSFRSGHAPVTFWQPKLTSRFLQVLRSYRSTIQVAFAGHTHMDDFRVIRLDGEPVLLGKIAPAISPIFGNNPGYQIFQHDRDTGALRNYQTHFLTNLPEASAAVEPATGRWDLEYDFRDAYGQPALDARIIFRISQAMRNDQTVRQRYTRYYGVSADMEFTDTTFAITRSAIANVTPADFLKQLDNQETLSTAAPVSTK